MLELLLKLVDRLIDLAKRREEVRRASFNDFVSPAMADFELVHKDYLETFRRYRGLLEDKAIPLTLDHPILSAIKTDNLFSEDLRAKLFVLDLSTSDSPLKDFLLKVHAYIAKSKDDLPNDPDLRRQQVIRVDYASYLNGILLSKLSDAAKRERALVALDQEVQLLQIRYGDVIKEFHKLRATLLRPR